MLKRTGTEKKLRLGRHKGLRPEKYTFFFKVHSVVGLVSLDNSKTAVVKWKRGSRHSGSTSVADVRNGVVSWEDSFSLDATLYSDKSGGGYEKKVLEMVVVESKSEKKGKPVVLGVLHKDLATFLRPHRGSDRYKYKLDGGVDEDAVINISVTCRVGTSKDQRGLDASSRASSMSDVTARSYISNESLPVEGGEGWSRMDGSEEEYFQHEESDSVIFRDEALNSSHLSTSSQQGGGGGSDEVGGGERRERGGHEGMYEMPQQAAASHASTSASSQPSAVKNILKSFPSLNAGPALQQTGAGQREGGYGRGGSSELAERDVQTRSRRSSPASSPLVVHGIGRAESAGEAEAAPAPSPVLRPHHRRMNSDGSSARPPHHPIAEEIVERKRRDSTHAGGGRQGAVEKRRSALYGQAPALGGGGGGGGVGGGISRQQQKSMMDSVSEALRKVERMEEEMEELRSQGAQAMADADESIVIESCIYAFDVVQTEKGKGQRRSHPLSPSFVLHRCLTEWGIVRQAGANASDSEGASAHHRGFIDRMFNAMQVVARGSGLCLSTFAFVVGNINGLAVLLEDAEESSAVDLCRRRLLSTSAEAVHAFNQYVQHILYPQVVVALFHEEGSRSVQEDASEVGLKRLSAELSNIKTVLADAALPSKFVTYLLDHCLAKLDSLVLQSFFSNVRLCNANVALQYKMTVVNVESAFTTVRGGGGGSVRMQMTREACDFLLFGDKRIVLEEDTRSTHCANLNPLQLLALVKNFRDERRQGVPADVVDKFQALVDSADIVLTLDGVSNKAEKPPLFPVEGMDSDIEEALAKCRIALPAPLLSRSTFAFLHVSV